MQPPLVEYKFVEIVNIVRLKFFFYHIANTLHT